MNIKNYMECEAKRLRKLHLLPNKFKKIAVVLAIVSIFGMAAPRLIGEHLEIVRSVSKNLFLIAMLIFTVSKDRFEDELTMQLRAQSYTWAFIFGVGYAILQPLITYMVLLLLKPEKAIFTDSKVFIVLWFMLTVQILFFYVLKKAR
jgi:hypothetical protein